LEGKKEEAAFFTLARTRRAVDPDLEDGGDLEERKESHVKVYREGDGTWVRQDPLFPCGHINHYKKTPAGLPGGYFRLGKEAWHSPVYKGNNCGGGKKHKGGGGEKIRKGLHHSRFLIDL